MSAEVSSFLEALSLEQVGEGQYLGRNFVSHPGAPIFGGQILAQAVVAGATVAPDKLVKTIHNVFARGGDATKPLEIEVETMSAGRAMASATVSMRQEGMLCARSIVFLTAEEPDLIRYSEPMPNVPGPDACEDASREAEIMEVRVPAGYDLMATGSNPPELPIWMRFVDGGTGGVIDQALFAYGTDGFLIGTALRPHADYDQSMAHTEISTTVLTHTLTFHEPFDASQWHLVQHSSPYAGRGRTYGRADVFGTDGRIVASFVQDNMVRDFPKGNAPGGGGRSKF